MSTVNQPTEPAAVDRNAAFASGNRIKELTQLLDSQAKTIAEVMNALTFQLLPNSESLPRDIKDPIERRIYESNLEKLIKGPCRFNARKLRTVITNLKEISSKL